VQCNMFGWVSLYCSVKKIVPGSAEPWLASTIHTIKQPVVTSNITVKVSASVELYLVKVIKPKAILL